MAEQTGWQPGLWASLDRLEQETARAYQAFLDYVRLGDGRSLRKLHQQYRGQGGGETGVETPPTRRQNTLEEWSARFQWQDRLDGYLAERAAQDQADWEERRRALRGQDWLAGSALRDLAAQILDQSRIFDGRQRIVHGRDGQPVRVVKTLALHADVALRALKLASDLQRQAAGVPDPVQRHEVFGRDGGPIQSSSVVIYLPDNGRGGAPAEAAGDGDGA